MIANYNSVYFLILSVLLVCLILLIAFLVGRLSIYKMIYRKSVQEHNANERGVESLLGAGQDAWFIHFLETSTTDDFNRRHEQLEIDQFAAETRNIAKRYVIWLISYEKSGKKSAQSIVEITHQMDHLTELVGQVRESSLQAKLLALNVAIDAAKCGEGGTEMAFVAEQVRRLSQHSEDFSLNIHKEVSEAKDTVQQARDVVDDRTTKELTAAISTQTHIELLIDELIRILNGEGLAKANGVRDVDVISIPSPKYSNRFLAWLLGVGQRQELERKRLMLELDSKEKAAQVILDSLLSRIENLRDELEFWLLQRSIPATIRQELFEIIIVLKRLEKAKIGRKNNKEGLAS